MSQSPEMNLVENPLVDNLVALGWKLVKSEDLERDNFHDPLLLPNLSRAIQRINKEKGITDEEVKEALNELRFVPSGAEGSKKILQCLKDGVLVKSKKDRVPYNAELFDYKVLSNNEFIISRQVYHEAGEKKIRNDIILYVNGIPVVNIECKNPANPTEDWYTAYRQIKDYEKTVPELYKYVQIGVAVHFEAKYFPIVPWQEDVWCYEWKGTTKDPLKDLLEMLSPKTLLELVRNYLFYRVEMGKSTKVIARYVQFRASEKLCNRVIDYVLGRSEKNKGLIWHWQGSGKTLTMIFAANKLYRSREMENPTIFVIVDREELEKQHYAEFNALDITKPEVVDSIESLKKILKHDGGRGKRGIFLTLVHKFRPEELSQLQQEFASLQNVTISGRKNVVVLVDEAHRTQYGTLAGQMRAILKKASYFAFTGTPISKVGRDTYIEFSYPGEEKYLDKYFIVDAINDGYTVKIAYQPRLEKEVQLNKELLDQYLGQVFDYMDEDLREIFDEKAREKINAITVFLKNPTRIEKIARDIAQHFRSEVEGKYKAMVVAVNREACVEYKRALDSLLPKEWSEVVMTYNRSDPEVIRQYQEELMKRFPGKEMEEIKDEIVGKFKEEENPKILIVTDMLLTGFDAPILQTMYLDKPLKEHRLLQAIARTNRPYQDLKEAGVVVDYVGIFNDVKKAFEIYSSEEIRGAISNFTELKREFEEMMSKTIGIFEGVPKGELSRETMTKCLEIITESEEKTKQFVENYRKIRKLFEVIGTDEIKQRLLSDYKWLTAIYGFYISSVRSDLRPREIGFKKYFKKTIEYVYETMEIGDPEKMPVIEFGPDFLKKIEEEAKSKEEKAANIVFALHKYILTDKRKGFLPGSISDKVDRIVRMWKEKNKDYLQIYSQGKEVLEELQGLEKRRAELGFNDMEYSVLLVLEEGLGRSGGIEGEVREFSSSLKGTLFPGWQAKPSARKEVEKSVRKFLWSMKSKHGLAYDQLDSLSEKIMECVKQHG